MGTFKQYVKSSRNTRKAENYYYVCGDYKRAVEYVLIDIARKVRALPENFYTFSLNEHDFSSFFTVLSQKTIDRRFIQLRDAEQLKEFEWKKIRNWAGTAPSTTLVLVTNEDTARSKDETARYKWFMKNGKFIQCRKFTDNKTAHKFVMEFLDVSEVFADWIIETVGADPDILLDELEKIRLSGFRTIKEVQYILQPRKVNNYVEMLYSKDPAIEKMKMSEEEFGLFLQNIERDVVNQAATIGLARKNMRPFEIAPKLGLQYRNFTGLSVRSTKTNANELAARLDLISRTQEMFNNYGLQEGMQKWFIRMWKRTK